MYRYLRMLAGAALLVGECGPVVAGPAAAAEPAVALVSKVILDVKRKEVDKDWVIAKRGETLASGDMVRTGEKSIAVVKFKDNSLVRVREKSEITVTGITSGTSFSKSIDIINGTIGFSVKKQLPSEDFRFSSPTSVASVRGTGGQFISQRGYDTLVVTEGRVRLRNKISSNEIDVQEGFTAISHPDGTITQRPSTEAELQGAAHALQDSEQENRLEFDFRDGQGNRKQLKIDFK